jgi:hypothetical protein
MRVLEMRINASGKFEFVRSDVPVAGLLMQVGSQTMVPDTWGNVKSTLDALLALDADLTTPLP